MELIKFSDNKVYVMHKGCLVSNYGFEKGIVTRNRTAVFAHKHLVVYDNNTQKELFSILGMEIFFFPKVMITRIDGLYGAYSYDNKCILSPKYEKITVKKYGVVATSGEKSCYFNFDGKFIHEYVWPNQRIKQF